MIPLVLCPDPYMRASLSAAIIARAVDIVAMRVRHPCVLVAVTVLASSCSFEPGRA